MHDRQHCFCYEPSALEQLLLRGPSQVEGAVRVSALGRQLRGHHATVALQATTLRNVVINWARIGVIEVMLFWKRCIFLALPRKHVFSSNATKF